MKAKNVFTVVLVGVLMLALTSFSSVTNNKLALQDGLIITAVFDGAEDYGYNFIYTNDEEDERTITFQIEDEAILKAFNLKSDALIGTAMKVTYNSVIKIETDEDDFEEEVEVNTITKLELLKK
jgi:hypothetical protein